MSRFSPLVRKVIYLSAIGVLLILLSLVSLPETRDETGGIKFHGGVLSQLRNTNGLSQANLSEIDPASETMKLASLGLRGVAVCTLWMQAMDHKKKEQYEQLESTLKALTKIQPNFVKVWEFQAHNLAYNVSMEFDDYEYRYYWVKRGIEFLKDGIDFNKTDHRITDSLGFFTGNKMGKSDEKDSFRRMFRQDDDFHQEMSKYILPESYDTRHYGHDSWKMAYQWYDLSRQIVDEDPTRQRTSDMLFYMYRPAQLRNEGMSLQNEFRTDEVLQEIWRTAHEQWLEYGDEPLTNTLAVTYTLEGKARNEKQLDDLRAKLDQLVPGVRDELVSEMLADADIPEIEMAAWKMPFDQRTDEQLRLARNVNEVLSAIDTNLDAKIAARAKPNEQLKARRLVDQIQEEQSQLQTIDKDSGTVNYVYWRARTAAESTRLAVEARQALFDAEEMRRKSIYDDEFKRDYKTKKVTITKRGAISLYLEAFEKWREVLDQVPDLKTGPTADDLAKSMQEFRAMLITTHREWPENFPLQELIDFRVKNGDNDKLPTSEELEEQRSALSDEP